MSDVFFAELEIPPPDHHLGVGSARHGAQTGEMLVRLEDVLLREKPDSVLVYGDTNSTLAGALAAAKLNIPVSHVEAGLRSFNRTMPEEINRIVADHLSDFLFAPTDAAVKNLHHEGIPASRIFRTGDVMYDAALYYGRKAELQSDILRQLDLTPKKYVLATVHRAENTDAASRLQAIFSAFAELAREITVVMPLHPRTRQALQALHVQLDSNHGLKLITPVGYLDMIMLEKNAALIATDSGGVQKEAFFYGVPCTILRAETEWVELVESGWNTLVSPAEGPARIVEVVRQSADGAKPSRPEIYGDGNSAQLIVRQLQKKTRAALGEHQ